MYKLELRSRYFGVAVNSPVVLCPLYLQRIILPLTLAHEPISHTILVILEFFSHEAAMPRGENGFLMGKKDCQVHLYN